MRLFLTGILSVFFLSGHFFGGVDEQTFETPAIPFNPRSYVCFRTVAPLTIDGILNEVSWEKTSWTDFFVDISVPGRKKPRYRTRAKMLWDDQFFYVAASLEEPHVWATLRERDAVIFQDNDFEVFIDPDGDTHLYYELEINALGTVWDLLLEKPYRDGGKALNGWDIRGLQSACRIDGTLNNPLDRDKGWTVELAFPWEVLKEMAPEECSPGPGDVWRVNFSRVEWENEIQNGRYVKRSDPDTGKPLPEDNWVWSPQGLVNMHYPEMWGFVRFSGVTAGGEEIFRIEPEEKTKWLLRLVYYRQKLFYEKHGVFSSETSPLGLATLLGEKMRQLQLERTQSLFEAALPCPEGEGTWRIRQDGLVWKKDKEKRHE
ncbi:MAG: carbohydrate-binding family 9-like protein [Candidatus Aminicenantes bacterium]|nr:carbohydrate-binding family 9-like protein [Candidatus Aminicenantes bacterium]